MTGRLLAYLSAAVCGILLVCSGLLGALFLSGGTASAGCPTAHDPSSAPPITLTPPPGGFPTIGTWNPEQVANAAIIIAVGQSMQVPPRGWVIAVATAMQESSLINTPGGDQDSIGLFQQRPSQGWGTPAQLHDPAYAAGKFYTKLLTIDGWQGMPLADAAQAVQVSSAPQEYAKWEAPAVALIGSLAAIPGGQVPANLEQAMTNPFCLIDGGDGQPSVDTTTLPAGFSIPPGTAPAVVTAIGWALAQLGTPYHFGGDCTAAHSGVAAHECDCSSLVQQAYRAAGITIPRTTADQLDVGTPIIQASQIMPGDLLFIPGSDGTPARPGHVGMAIGQGLLVQAPHNGDLVKISKSSSWADNLAAIRRVIP